MLVDDYTDLILFSHSAFTCSVSGPVANFALWSTNSAAFHPAVTTVYDNSLLFSPSAGRTSFEYETTYTIKVSYRPQIGYYRVTMTRVSDGAIIADTGNQYDAAGISNVS